MRLVDGDTLWKKVTTEFDEFLSLADLREYLDNEAPIEKRFVEIPETGIGDLSDGYHTFNGLYEQRMVLFAALVKAYRDRAWKSYRHEDGEYCFGGGWFIVGIDTPEGSYTYHYENKYWNMFDCIDLPRAPHWDGHTEADAEVRLMSLEPERKKGQWQITDAYPHNVYCPECHVKFAQTNWAVWEDGSLPRNFCPNCGAPMERGEEDG